MGARDEREENGIATRSAAAMPRLAALATIACVAWVALPLSLLPLLFLPSRAHAQAPTADYEVVFESTWTALTHPIQFPADPHFSRPIGATHDDTAVFWEPGGLASPGIEDVAEIGGVNLLWTEFGVEMAAGSTDQRFLTNGFDSPGSVTITFTADLDFPNLTLVSMLAPSPDWFVGVHGYPLLDQGWWIDERTIDLHTYDAGTDLGASYESPDADADPQLPIALQGFPLEVGVPVGTFTIRRLPEPDVSLGVLAGSMLLARAISRRTVRRDERARLRSG